MKDMFKLNVKVEFAVRLCIYCDTIEVMYNLTQL